MQLSYLPGSAHDTEALRFELLRRTAQREFTGIYAAGLGVALVVVVQWGRIDLGWLLAFALVRLAALLHNHVLAERILHAESLASLGSVPARLLAGMAVGTGVWGSTTWMVLNAPPFDSVDLLMVVLPVVATALILVTAAYWWQAMLLLILPMWLVVLGRLVLDNRHLALNVELVSGVGLLLVVLLMYGRQLHRQAVSGVAAELLSRQLGDALQRSNERLAAALARANRRAARDPLTGLMNRRAMRERLTAESRRQVASGGEATVLLMDLDHFKAINDRHGHALGDAVLVRTARAMRATLRQDDLLARWGGEEFLAVLPDQSPMEGHLAAERLRRAVAMATRQCAPGLNPTISVGLAHWGSGAPIDDAIRRADAALYAAKAAGRDRVAG